MLWLLVSHFREEVLKHETVDDDENDTLEFTLKKTWKFQPKLSNGLNGNEIVTTLHPGIEQIIIMLRFFLGFNLTNFFFKSSLKISIKFSGAGSKC